MKKSEADVATKESWWKFHTKPEDPSRDSGEKLQPMPESYIAVPLDFYLDARQAARVRQGFIPAQMEEKWFAYFENNTLYQHRSWTGYCIDQTHFVEEGEGLRATHAEVNRDFGQYQNTDDAEDIERITNAIQCLSNLSPGASSKMEDSFAAAMQASIQPNYLGSPEVMKRVVTPFYEACILEWFSDSYPEKELDSLLVTNEKKKLINILRGKDKSYTVIGTWNSTSELGNSARKYFCLDADSCDGESLGFILVQSLDAIQEHIAAMLEVASVNFEDDEDYEELRESYIEMLSPIRDFAGAVFMGTNTVLMPDKTLHNYEWGEGI